MDFLPSHADGPAGRRAGRPAAALGRRRGEVRLVLSAHRPGERPKGGLPAAIVLGRSNVGKSSLLNALLGIPAARVSATPGRTRGLYWYRVDDAFDVVDCPGYGFAKAGREERRKLETLIEEMASSPVAAALLLVDGRLAPQESDRSMALFLENRGIPTVVVATKWDAVRPSSRTRQLRALSAEHARDHRPLLPVSSETGENLDVLVRLLRERLEARPRGRAPSGAPALPA